MGDGEKSIGKAGAWPCPTQEGSAGGKAGGAGEVPREKKYGTPGARASTFFNL